MTRMSTPQQRDAALEKLRTWRTTIALGGAGAVVAFGTVAAVTVPGKASPVTTTAPADATQQQQQQQQPDQPQDSSSDNSLQAPQQLPSGGFAGGGQAVSGGSR